MECTKGRQEGGWAIYYGRSICITKCNISQIIKYYNRNTIASIIKQLIYNCIGDNVIGIGGKVSDFNNGFINI